MAASFLPVRQALAITAFIAGASFCMFDGKWHSQPSFFYLNQLPIPWQVYGVALIVAGCTIPFKSKRAVGYCIGAIVYSIFSVAVWLAVIGGFHPHLFLFKNFPQNTVGSFFGACNVTTISVVYWVCLKIAIDKQVDSDNEILGS